MNALLRKKWAENPEILPGIEPGPLNTRPHTSLTVRPTDPGNGFKNAPEPKLVLLYFFYVIMETLANWQH